MLSEKTTLGAICQIFSGNAWSAAKFNTDGDGIPIIRIQNIESVASRQFVYWNGSYDKRFVINPGDILLTLSGSFRVCVWEGPEALLNQRIVKLTPDANVNANWFLHYLQNQLKHIEQMGRHALVNNVAIADLKRMSVALPPLDEQKRIAAILDKAEELRAKCQSTENKADQLLMAAIEEMLSVAATHGTRPLYLEDCADIASGVTKGRKLWGYDVLQLPYLRVANVQAGRIDLSEVKTIEALYSDLSRYRLLPGDVLLTEGGDHDKLGRGAMWRGEIQNCIHQNHIFRVRTDRAFLLPEFLEAYLRTSGAKSYFLRCAKKTTNLASINMSQLKKLPIPFVPIPTQKEFSLLVKKTENVRQLLGIRAEECNEAISSLNRMSF